MSYAGTGLGKIYNISITLPGVGKQSVALEVPFEQVVSDTVDFAIGKAVPAIKEKVGPIIQENWPKIKGKIVEAIPEVVDAALKATKGKESQLQKVVRSATAPVEERVALGAAAVVVALIVGGAIIAKRRN